MAKTLVELRKVASELKIAGRSKMGKTDLMRAVQAELDRLHAEALDMDATMAEVARAFKHANAVSPMSNSRRTGIYLRQNGTRGRITARQACRIRKHARKHTDIMGTIDLDFADSFERSL